MLILINHQSPKPLILKKLFFITALFSSFMLSAQERKPLKGKVTSDSDDLEGIYVINRNTEATVATARGGYFTISAQPNDTLIFSAAQIEAVKVIVKESDFGEDLLFVPVKAMIHELDPVVLTEYRNITSESLGLVPIGQKQYTPSERKLATASAWKMNPMGLDPVINAITGRTAMLEKAAETAKKEDLMEKISYIYSEEDIISEFKIPLEYVRGFIFYVIENRHFVAALKAKNLTMAKFLLGELSVKYLQLLKE